MSLLERTDVAAGHDPPDEDGSEHDRPDREPAEPVVDLAQTTLPRAMPKGMRIGRLRVRSVAKIAGVFLTFGYLVTIATGVVVWNVLHNLGFVNDLEEMVVTSLGVDSFDIVGSDLFDLFTVGAGVLFAMGFILVLLLTLVYNATCALFGGLAVETTPVRGWRRYRRLIRS